MNLYEIKTLSSNKYYFVTAETLDKAKQQIKTTEATRSRLIIEDTTVSQVYKYKNTETLDYVYSILNGLK